MCYAMGAVWPAPLGGSKTRPIASIWNSAPLSWTGPAGANCDGRPPSPRASNSRAFVFVISASPCSLPSKNVGLLLLSRHLCPDGKKCVAVQREEKAKGTREEKREDHRSPWGL